MTQGKVLGRTLLDWYDANKRTLPWRDEGASPYRTWVSEIMLQQTRVEAVIPFFERFMAAFPTVDALAEARLDDVLRLWAGLGYYSRARNLHRAAGMVVESGRFPVNIGELRMLPGVGEYIAGAIASIALNLDEPTVDGNIHRVLSRVHCQNVSRPKMFEIAGQHLPEGRAGDYNQALMDLGSAICTPRKPRCGSCPIRSICRAQLTGRQAEFPIKKKKKARPDRQAIAFVMSKQGRVLLVRRPEKGLFGGLYDLPGTFQDQSKGGALTAYKVVEEQLGIQISPGKKLFEISHILTHMRIVTAVHECAWKGRWAPGYYTDINWAIPGSQIEVGVSTLCQKVLNRLAL